MCFRKLFHNLLPGVSLAKGCLSLKKLFLVPIRQRGANLYTTFPMILDSLKAYIENLHFIHKVELSEFV